MSTTRRVSGGLVSSPAPVERIALPAPPDLGEIEQAGGGSLASLLPMLAGVGALVLLGGLGAAGGTGAGLGSRSLIGAAAFLLATVGFVALQLDRQRATRARRVSRLRSDYRRQLEAVRAAVRTAATHQRLAAMRRHPEPAALPTLVSDGFRDRHRTPEDPDFLQVRYGLGTHPLAAELALPPPQPDTVDPASMTSLHRLRGVHGVQRGLPVALDLTRLSCVHVDGPAARTRSLVRSIICSAAATHAPEQLRVAALVTSDSLPQWTWLKWLPHHGSAVAADVAGPVRLLSTDAAELAALLERERGSGAHLLVIDDAGTATKRAEPWGDTVLRVGPVAPASPSCLSLQLIGPDEVREHKTGSDERRSIADRCDPNTAEALARRLAGTARARRRQQGAGEHLVARIGSSAAGPVSLDLKESAVGGVGPHGLLVGATGSGKSELLRTLVLRLALTHSTDELNLALVDFKGGATFADLAPLPHVAALITNLASDQALIGRMQDALSGELVRRQVLLSRGSHASAQDYEAARRAGADLEPLPALLVVVDEFSELLTARPEVIDTLIGIGRLGRSLGVHLLLASQRLEEGRLRGLESHLSYRIALRTFSAADSRAVLGGPEAFDLPPEAGVGLLQAQGGLLRFRADYVSGPAAPQAAASTRVVPFTTESIPRTTESPTHVPSSTLEVAVAAMRRHGPSARPLWLPPLGDPTTLGSLMPPSEKADPLTVTIGELDRPREQRRDPLRVDLTLAHLAIVGGPRSGKSTALATTLASIAVSASPEQAQVYVVDLGGGMLSRFADLPHVAAVATRAAPEVVRRVVDEVDHLLDRRERLFASEQVDSVENYRQRRACGGPGDGYGDILVLVDGWGALRTEFEDLETRLQDWATRGSSFGMHLVVATTRWSDFRPTTRDLFGHRLELRLGDPLDSEIDRARAARVPEQSPGRGLSSGALEVMVALPRLDGDPDPLTLGAGIAGLVDRAREAWSGRQAPPLKLLPADIDLTAVRRQREAGAGLLLGLAEPDLSPLALDPDTDPHLLVLGDSGSGRTNLLRVLCREIARTRGPDRAQLLLLDPRRGLLGEGLPQQLLAHRVGGSGAAEAVAELADHLTRRLPGPEVSPDQLRHRSWWTGADVFVVVDDYELMSLPISPLTALAPLLPHARDVGLHLFLARRCGGAGRALYEPVLQGLRDLGTPGILLSGSPDEGPLLGGLRPEAAPPGRARLITRGPAVRQMQVAYITPEM